MPGPEQESLDVAGALAAGEPSAVSAAPEAGGDDNPLDGYVAPERSGSEMAADLLKTYDPLAGAAEAMEAFRAAPEAPADSDLETYRVGDGKAIVTKTPDLTVAANDLAMTGPGGKVSVESGDVASLQVDVGAEDTLRHDDGAEELDHGVHVELRDPQNQ